MNSRDGKNQLKSLLYRLQSETPDDLCMDRMLDQKLAEIEIINQQEDQGEIPNLLSEGNQSNNEMGTNNANQLSAQRRFQIKFDETMTQFEQISADEKIRLQTMMWNSLTELQTPRAVYLKTQGKINNQNKHYSFKQLKL